VTLLGGGGVDGQIHRAAGSHMKRECETLNGCRPGEAKITKGYNLPANYVIHTVGPVGENPSKLAECYENSLNLAVSKEIKTIGFCCISTGIYGYPLEKSAHVWFY
jgi:O-acetyl-ADP-ribose deacetylase (regulator of RNase III)